MRDWSLERKWRMKSKSGEIEGNKKKEKEVETYVFHKKKFPIMIIIGSICIYHLLG